MKHVYHLLYILITLQIGRDTRKREKKHYIKFEGYLNEGIYVRASEHKQHTLEILFFSDLLFIHSLHHNRKRKTYIQKYYYDIDFFFLFEINFMYIKFNCEANIDDVILIED